jgi:hypothetical protein
MASRCQGGAGPARVPAIVSPPNHLSTGAPGLRNPSAIFTKPRGTYEDGTRSVFQLPDEYDEAYVEGLDGAQREMVYERCGGPKWHTLNRFPVKNFKDLVYLWGGELAPVQKPFTLSLGGG